MSEKNKKEKLSTVLVDPVFKKGIEKLKFTGDIAQVCDPEQVRADMRLAKEHEGMIYVYKRKKELKAICIFDVEEREIPLNAALVDQKKVLADALKEQKDRVATPDEGTELVSRKCYVLRGFYVAPSYEDRRDEFKNIFTKVASEHMLEYVNEIPAYFWEDELVMSNQILSGGKMVSAASIGASMGAGIGMLLGILIDSDGIHNLGMWLLWGMVIGGALCAGTTTMKSKITFVK